MSNYNEIKKLERKLNKKDSEGKYVFEELRDSNWTDTRQIYTLTDVQVQTDPKGKGDDKIIVTNKGQVETRKKLLEIAKEIVQISMDSYGTSVHDVCNKGNIASDYEVTLTSEDDINKKIKLAVYFTMIDTEDLNDMLVTAVIKVLEFHNDVVKKSIAIKMSNTQLIYFLNNLDKTFGETFFTFGTTIAALLVPRIREYVKNTEGSLTFKWNGAECIEVSEGE